MRGLQTCGRAFSKQNRVPEWGEEQDLARCISKRANRSINQSICVIYTPICNSLDILGVKDPVNFFWTIQDHFVIIKRVITTLVTEESRKYVAGV